MIVFVLIEFSAISGHSLCKNGPTYSKIMNNNLTPKPVPQLHYDHSCQHPNHLLACWVPLIRSQQVSVTPQGEGSEEPSGRSVTFTLVELTCLGFQQWSGLIVSTGLVLIV